MFPIAGDLAQENLGLSDQDRLTIAKEVQVVINCAASVNFDDPLLDALNINYFGTLRMLELAKDCKIECFTHVSTAYVNSNQQGRILEQVYERDQDPDQIVANILRMNPKYIQENQKQIIGKWPNTYTFSKCLAEQAIAKRSRDMKITIVRPSIVISTAFEPILGWTETISAMGGLTFATMLGLINYLFCDDDLILDIIPVDLVSNLIIASTAFTSQAPPGTLNVIHCSSSQQNPANI